jgi:phytoene synthase
VRRAVPGALPIPLEEPYRGRALAPGTARYFSWLFAEPRARDPLLGMYALCAEWRALLDPSTEREAAVIKLGWWREEIARLMDGAPLHPITRFIAALPRASRVSFADLNTTIESAARQLAGAPLEHGAELESHGAALWAAPLVLAAQLAQDLDAAAEPGVRRAMETLGAAQYLEDALRDYRREALHGRVIFPVDELLAAGVEDADMTAVSPPPALKSYLEKLRGQAAEWFRAVADELPAIERAALRHALVLAALGLRHLRGGATRTGSFRPADLYEAWSTARRAARPAFKR